MTTHRFNTGKPELNKVLNEMVEAMGEDAFDQLVDRFDKTPLAELSPVFDDRLFAEPPPDVIEEDVETPNLTVQPSLFEWAAEPGLSLWSVNLSSIREGPSESFRPLLGMLIGSISELWEEAYAPSGAGHLSLPPKAPTDWSELPSEAEASDPRFRKAA